MVLDKTAAVNRALRRFLRLDGAERLEDRLALQDATQEMVKLARVLNEREQAGQETALRQLHTCTDLSQREALQAARLLELATFVTIEPDHTDAFASLIRLTDPARRQLKSRSDQS